MATAVTELPVREALLEQLIIARRQTDDLFAIVQSDALYDRPIVERHRIVFYIGHLEAFDWNLFHDRVLGLESFNADFDRLFAFGIDPVGGGLPTDQPSQWPSIDDVRDYVKEIRSVLDEKLLNALDSDRLQIQIEDQRGESSLHTLLNVSIEHRLMHAETLAYMLHQLPFDRKIHRAELLDLDNPPVDHRSIEIPAGPVVLGLPRDSGIFGWDNEFESHTVEVPTFSIDKYKVTNRQYLEFIEADGYQTSSYWGAGDGNWILENRISHPAFWKRGSNDNWFFRTMFEDVPLPLDWPVYVSQAEAKAYASWAGKSLPTEAEWQRAAYCTPGGDQRSYPWGPKTPSAEFGNFDFARWSPAPVNAFASSKSAYGVQGMLGNGWEWTSSEFAPFPGFQAFSFYPGYSANFFDGKHFVMKGGSARTAACMLRPTFRNWFQAHYQFIYTGFRCVSR
jgi:gamma-glutamyl hercynylcysteine S-oxide synthase